jgi:hypothetical protein
MVSRNLRCKMMGLLKFCTMIGCTILRAVSGILRTQRGRRGSGLGRQLAVSTCAGLVRRSQAGHCHLWSLRLRPLRPCGSTLSPCGSTRRSLPLWLNSSPPWLSSSLLAPLAQLLARVARPTLTPGRRRAVPTSHWPWVSSRAACRRAESPARIAIAVYVGAQWGWLGLARPEADRRQHRVP